MMFYKPELVQIPSSPIQLLALGFVDACYRDRLLDFSLGSLATLDRLLGHFATNEPSDEERELMVKQAGCYILEVARRMFGGRYFWWVERDMPVLVQNEIRLASYERVRLRIERGDEENIPCFFAEYVTFVSHPCAFSDRAVFYV